jgi:hypothetical protein
MTSTFTLQELENMKQQRLIAIKATLREREGLVARLATIDEHLAKEKGEQTSEEFQKLLNEALPAHLSEHHPHRIMFSLQAFIANSTKVGDLLPLPGGRAFEDFQKQLRIAGASVSTTTPGYVERSLLSHGWVKIADTGYERRK